MHASVRTIDAPRPILQGTALVGCALGMACRESVLMAPTMVVKVWSSDIDSLLRLQVT